MADDVHPMLGDPNAPVINWSHFNQPFGSVTPTTPTPSERLGDAASSVLQAAGAQPYVANHLVNGVGNVLGMTPLAAPIFAADALDAQRRGDTGGVVQAMAGMIPGARPEAKAAEEALQAGIRAYHGSPHNFDAFDLSKIGTGEGAQAYGHGLYFAQNENVAKGYRDALSPPMSPLANDFIAKHGGDTDAALAAFDKQWGDTFPSVRKEIETGKPANPGHMYEVNINADPAHFLDWDKPLSEQSEHVRNALSGKIGDNETVASALGRAYRNPMHGGDIVGLPEAGPSEISAGLARSGIPGIKYLDQGSRGAGEGSRNYVVFDDKLVNILRKYGFAGFIPAAGAAAPIFANGDDQSQ